MRIVLTAAVRRRFLHSTPYDSKLTPNRVLVVIIPGRWHRTCSESPPPPAPIITVTGLARADVHSAPGPPGDSDLRPGAPASESPGSAGPPASESPPGEPQPEPGAKPAQAEAQWQVRA